MEKPDDSVEEFLRMDITPLHLVRWGREKMLQHADVAMQLMRHLDDADPDLAKMWRSQLDRERAETGHRGLVVYLRGEFLDVLRKHPRYGYLAEWMAEWTDEAESWRTQALTGC